MRWEIGTTFSGKVGIWDPNGTGKTICHLPGYDDDKKNAALIAAAPEMLEAMQRLVKCIEIDELMPRFFPPLEAAKLAIKKATT